MNEDSSSELDSESDHSATTDTESHGGFSSDEKLGEGDQPVCEGTSIVINSVCDMERLTVLIQTTPNLYKMCGACAIC